MPTIKDLWLRDEDGNITVLPYTSLDNIKIRNGNNFTDFRTVYDSLTSAVNNNQININNLNTTVQTLSQLIEGIEEATETSNGFMSAADKRKLNGIEEGATAGGGGGSGGGGYSRVPIATDSTPGIVMVDDDTIIIDENGTIAARSALAANELTYAETMAILNASS